MRMLIDAGADVNGYDDEALLCLVIRGGNPAHAPLLLEAGANVHLTRSGQSFLDATVLVGTIEMVDLFLEHGASITELSYSPWHPLGSFQSNGKRVDICSLEMMAKLLQAEVLFNNKTDTTFGTAPLHVAAATGSLPHVNLLLDAGAEINSPSILDQKTPLHYAASTLKPYCSRPSQLEVISLLVANGANPFVFDRAGRLPLHYACTTGNEILVEELLRAMGSHAINQPDEDSMTPLHHASSSSVVSYLISRGAA